MSEVTKAYEAWKLRNDKVIDVDGKLFYRIIWSDSFKLSGYDKEILCAVISPDMPKGKDYEDENGNHFTFKGFNHIRFIDEIPDWYLEAGECCLEWHETKDIGNYLKVIDSIK